MQVPYENLTVSKYMNNYICGINSHFASKKQKLLIMKTKEQFRVHQFIFTAIFIVLFLFFGKIGSAQSNENYFDVYHTKVETWAGGAYGSGSSESYSFSIKLKKDVKILFDTVWVGSSPSRLTNSNFSEINKKKYLKGDTAKISLMFYYPGERDRLYNPDKIILEEKQEVVNLFPNDKYIALIKFYVNNVKYYYEVKKIDESIFNALP